MKDFDLKPLPATFGRSYLERYRIHAKEHLRPSGVGRHLQLYRGQSLDFRDFTEYTLGDDIRAVDWRASARYRGPKDWLVRNYVSEEAFKLVISIDTRESMFFPRNFEKVQQAAWLAELLGRIALHAGDQVYFHLLFGSATPTRLFENPESQVGLFPWLRRNTRHWSEEKLNLATARTVIYPVAAWVIISDFYLEEDDPIARKLAHFVREADEGWRWVILVNLNSWPYERSLLTNRNKDVAWKIEGPGLIPTDQPIEVDDPEQLETVEQKIRVAQDNFLELGRRTKFDSRWDWDDSKNFLDQEHFFKQHFENDTALKQLFRKPA